MNPDLCAQCSVPDHDTCALVDGCTCCADTRERMDDETSYTVTVTAKGEVI